MEHTQAQSVNPEVDYERSTISMPLVVWFAIAFVAFAIVSNIGLWYAWKYASVHSTQKSVVTSSVMTNTIETPGPRLQPSPGNDATPWEDLAATQAREKSEFQRRGWVNEKTGEIVIPDAIVEQVTKMSATTQPVGGGAR